MGLRDLNLKNEYRSDKNNLVDEFFIPCLDTCTKFDRAVEFIQVTRFASYYFNNKNVKNRPTIRLVTGHRMSTKNLNALVKIISQDRSKSLHAKIPFPLHSKLSQNEKPVQDMLKIGKLRIKIAIPDSDEVYETFGEKIGIFRDDTDVVAFTGTSNRIFDPSHHDFESLDVFTSWDDKTRVQTKIDNFENLWANQTRYITVFDIVDAIEQNKLQYSQEWLTSNY